MMTNSPEFGEVAAEFFERIGAETDTCVIWPSRLKIGAKSKKDPHIRVGGQEEGVKRAKMLITEVLDTTTNRLKKYFFDLYNVFFPQSSDNEDGCQLHRPLPHYREGWQYDQESHG